MQFMNRHARHNWIMLARVSQAQVFILPCVQLEAGPVHSIDLQMLMLSNEHIGKSTAAACRVSMHCTEHTAGDRQHSRTASGFHKRQLLPDDIAGESRACSICGAFQSTSTPRIASGGWLILSNAL